ncbi:ubiquitin-like-specific protease 1D [Triticum dicoccoides]|uniref:ubiquitin-like-specific protease 1D n=1 Tax=Triticum dicoccoides TaxID=85692 RepID=UPI00188E4706|nr:ubiquitin-like-specific protease 1D [Triticum dicoccoides]
MPNGPIIIDRAQMPLDSPPAEVEIIASSSPRVTPQPPAASDGASDGGEGDPDEFKRFTDEKLEERIKHWSGNRTLSVPDGGEKMRKFLCRMKKELDRRRAAGPRKVDTGRRQSAQTPSGDDPYTFKESDHINCSRFSDKWHCHGKGEAAFADELGHFNTSKRASQVEDRKRVTNTVNHQPKRRRVSQNIADKKHLDTNGRKLGMKICTEDQQKNNSVEPKGMSTKLRTEDRSSGSLTKRWDHSKNHTYHYRRLNRRNEKKVNMLTAVSPEEVVLLDDEDTELLDDEDTEPSKSVDVEIVNIWDKSQIYYPSKTHPETVELTYSDIKCLDPEVFLKSPVINFYIQYLKKSRPCDDLYIFNTYFYSKLEEALSRTGECGSQFSKLRRWWRSVDIFKIPYLLLPIHGQVHWSLVIIFMPAKEIESGPRVFHLDSLGLHSSDKVFGVIESYLIKEWCHLQKDSSYDIPFSGTIWRHLSRNIHKEKIEVPQQQNDFDCGVFMLYYIDKFIQEAPDDLTGVRPCKFGRKWFSPVQASGLRKRIRDLLLDIFQNAPPSDRNLVSDADDDSEDEEDKGKDTIVIV